jgi:hypothetical protein
MTEHKVIDKYQSLVRLEEWGYNVSPFRLYREADVEKIKKYLAPYPLLGVRTFRPWKSSPMLPFLFRVDIDAALKFCKDLPDEMGSFICQAFERTATRVNAEVLLTDDIRDWKWTVKYGPGVCREVETSAEIVNLERLPADFKSYKRALEDIRILFREDCVVEMSIMFEPCGYLNQRALYWEVRPTII